MKRSSDFAGLPSRREVAAAEMNISEEVEEEDGNGFSPMSVESASNSPALWR